MHHWEVAAMSQWCDCKRKRDRVVLHTCCCFMVHTHLMTMKTVGSTDRITTHPLPRKWPIRRGTWATRSLVPTPRPVPGRAGPRRKPTGSDGGSRQPSAGPAVCKRSVEITREFYAETTCRAWTGPMRFRVSLQLGHRLHLDSGSVSQKLQDKSRARMCDSRFFLAFPEEWKASHQSYYKSCRHRLTECAHTWNRFRYFSLMCNTDAKLMLTAPCIACVTE